MKKPLLNILIANDSPQSSFIGLIQKSKYLNKLYSTTKLEGVVDVGFNTFRELAEKCRALKIDIVIVESEKWALQGIADVLKKNLVNCMAPTRKTNELILSNSFARELLHKYNIQTPPKLLYPAKFPVVVRADGYCKIGNSLEEIIEIRKNISELSEEIAKTVFLEEFIEGECINLTSLFDGKNLLSFTDNDLLLEYSNKLQKLLIEEKFEFIGFLNSKLIIAKNKVYNIGFSSDLTEIGTNIDLIYLLSSAIYQKLDEITL